MNIRSRRAAVLAAAAATTIPSSASAGTPFTLGEGGHPDIAVDAGGTGHAVWRNQAAPNAGVRYCKLPPGATACTEQENLLDGVAGGAASPGPPFVLLGPGNRVIVGSADGDGVGSEDRLRLFVSNNGGTDFAAGVVTGTNRADSAILSADGTQVLSSTTRGPGPSLFGFQQAAVAGSADTARATLIPAGSSGSFFDAGLGFAGDVAGSPLLASFVGSGTITGLGATAGVFFNRLNDPATPNATASWSPPAKIDDGTQAKFAGGPSGAHVMYLNSVAAGLDFVVRKYNGTAWNAPSVVSSGDSSLGDPDLFQASNGALHSIYRKQISSVPDELRYFTPGFVNPGTVLTDTDINLTNVAVNATGQGWVVYATSLSDVGSSALSRAAPLTLIARSGGPASNQPTTTPPPPPPTSPPTKPGPVESLPTKTTTNKFGSGGAFSAGLIVPRSCIHLPNRFRVRATFRQIKTVRNRLLPARGQFRAVRVQFRLDNRIKSTDRKPAFTAILSTLGFRPGSTHTVSARIYLRQRRYRIIRGRKRLVTAKKLNVRTLRAKVKVC